MKESKLAVGSKIFRWTILSPKYPLGKGFCVDCICECGTQKPVNITSLSGKNPRSKSCGCLASEMKKGVILKPLKLGEVFSRLTVISEGFVENEKSKYLVRCECGVEKVVDKTALTSGATMSCGCLNRELSAQRKSNLRHGMSGTPIHNAWCSMRRRCYGENDSSYDNYGSRGITVCDRWMESFENFYEDTGDVPFEGASIERKDVNGNYCPENCVWADKTTQCFNRRKFEGKSSQYVGVFYEKDRNKPWRVSLKRYGKVVFSGSYFTELEAAEAYDEAALEHYGVRRNFPEKQNN